MLSKIRNKLNAIKKEQEYIDAVCQGAGWTKKQAKEALEHARELGMPKFRYVRNKCWNLTDEEIVALNERILKKKKYVKAVRDNTGWTQQQAKEALDHARELGMPNSRYVRNKCWDLTDEEIVELNKKLQKEREYVDAISQATGWTKKQAREAMDHAYQLGIPYNRYVNNQCWNMNDEEIIALNDKLQKKQEYINTICQATGWTEKQAEEALKHARELGMPNFRYVKNECWKLTDEELVALNNSILEKKEKRKKYEEIADSVSNETNLPKEVIVDLLRHADGLNIKTETFVERKLWDLSRKELREYARVSKKLSALKRKNNRFYVDVVCEKTGWSEDKVKEEMAKARELGITNLKFVQKAFWLKNEKEVAELAGYLQYDKVRIANNKKQYAEEICEKTGWPVAKVHLEVAKAKAICGASYEDYLAYRFYEKTPEQQKKFVTLDMFNKMRIKYNNHLQSGAEFDDKAKFNQNFADLIVHKWFVNNISYEEFLEKIKGLNKLIIKPLAATQGIGIEIVACNVSEEENKKLYEHIVSLDTSIVEEYIIQHEEMSSFCRTAVNTVRVMTIHHNNECHLLYSVFRMGKDKGVDNFHAGGVAAGVNINTGVVETNAVDLNGNVFTHSPATNREIKGFQIPNWDKVVELCAAASGRFEHTKLVGWDFAITENGVELIEGNPGGSYIVAQMPYVEDGIGLYDIMVKPYLDGFYE